MVNILCSVPLWTKIESPACIFWVIRVLGQIPMDEVNATDTVALTHVVKATDTINPD